MEPYFLEDVSGDTQTGNAQRYRKVHRRKEGVQRSMVQNIHWRKQTNDYLIRRARLRTGAVGRPTGKRSPLSTGMTLGTGKKGASLA